MTTKIYLAIIFSDYQELNLKRFIDHFHIKDEIIVFNGRFKGVNFQKKIIKSSSQFKLLVDKAISSNENTLYFAIFDSKNQRNYITVKLK